MISSTESQFYKLQIYLYKYRDVVFNQLQTQASYLSSCLLERLLHIQNLSYMIFYKTKLIPEYQTNATKFKNKIVDQVSCDFDFQAFQTLELTVKRLLDIKDYSQFMLAYGLEHATIVDDQSS